MGFALAVIVLALLIFQILHDGLPRLSFDFLWRFPSRSADKAGIYSALVGSFYIMLVTAILAVPIGIATALYLEEYLKRGFIKEVLQINISSLAGMPSILYGLLGLTIFARTLSLERSLITGALTLALMSLPVIIVAAQGAIRSVPQSLRDAAYALGARKHQVVLGQVLPAAAPGIITGVILSLSRAIGEAAPLILVGALSYISFLPSKLTDAYTVLPVQIYNWAGRPQPAFHEIAAAGIIVLLVLLFSLNIGAIIIRARYQRYR
jgi:phosphate transport system permease protein